MKPVRIGAIHYHIERDDMTLGRSENQHLSGLIDYERGQICIADCLSPSAALVVFLHEVLHGVLYSAGIREHDETQLDVLSNGLSMFLQDNWQIIMGYLHEVERHSRLSTAEAAESL
jgi:hypothetical protein